MRALVHDPPHLAKFMPATSLCTRCTFAALIHKLLVDTFVSPHPTFNLFGTGKDEKRYITPLIDNVVTAMVASNTSVFYAAW